MSEVKHPPGETMLAIRHGRVAGAVVIDSDDIHRETMAEWAADPDVEEMFRVPGRDCAESAIQAVAVARKLLAERSK